MRDTDGVWIERVLSRTLKQTQYTKTHEQPIMDKSSSYRLPADWNQSEG